MIDFLKGTITPKDWAALAGILALIAACTSAFYFMVHKKDLEEIAVIEAENEQVVTELNRAIEISNKIDQYREDTREIEELVRSFESRLPSKSEIPRLFEQVEEMAAEETISIEIEPLRQNQDENKETIPYQIKASGDFHKVASFINRLERFKRYLKVSDLKMSPYDKDGESTFDFKMNTYRFLKTMDTGESS